MGMWGVGVLVLLLRPWRVWSLVLLQSSCLLEPEPKEGHTRFAGE